VTGTGDATDSAGCVLVADDAAAGRGLVAGLVRQLGYDAVAVTDGAAALAAVRAEPGRFGLALLDIDMPVMDGPAAARAIGALDGAPPLVGLIAAGRAAEAQLALAAGMPHSLRKPVRRDALGAALDRLYRDPAGAAAPIDLAHLARYTAGDPGLERELLDLFRDNAEAYLAQLAAADADETWHRAAHTLKGAARGVGAGPIAELAQAAERLVGAQAEAGARAVAVRGLRVAIGVLRRAIHPERLEKWRPATGQNAGL